MISRFAFALYFILSIPFVFSQNVKLSSPFDSLSTPPAPDYSLNTNWAALPFIKDCADTCIGKGNCTDEQNAALADVFFIHPTTFTARPQGPNKWNGDVSDKKLNTKTNEGTIRYQASVFNQAGKIYAPYYRQAHYYSYQTPDKASATQAFEVAYSDVKRAFEFYLKTYNNHRPIIIASHSQGATHAIRLLKDFFDNKPLSSQLVCAYIIGMPVYDTVFQKLKPCLSEKDTNCYCSWRTYAVGYYPKKYKRPARFAVCTNPLLWTIDTKYAPSSLNKGGILKDMKNIIPGLCDAQVGEGVLRINKPHFKGSVFLKINNYHIADYNLFYVNIRENAMRRTLVFLEK